MMLWLRRAIVLCLSHVAWSAAMPTPETSTYGHANPRQAHGKMAPKVMILNMVRQSLGAMENQID